MRTFFLVPLLGGLFLAGPVRATEPTDQEREWLEHILLGTNPASPGVACVRWVKKNPTVTTFGASHQQTKAVEAALETLNEIMLATPIMKVELGKPSDKEADIKVHFAPEREFPALAKKYDFRYEKGHRTYIYVFWNGKRELTQAVALIPADAKGDELKRFVLREVTRSLGFPGTSPEFNDSIFFEKERLGTAASDLSRRDRKLINFFYNKVEPGMKQPQLRAQYKFW